MKRSLFWILVFIPIASIAQDSAWHTIKVDNQLSLSMPGTPEKVDTSITSDGIKQRLYYFKTVTPYAGLGVNVMGNQPSVDQNDNASLDKTYDEVKEGFAGSAREQGMAVKMSDTVIDKVRGFVATMDANGTTATNHLFLVGNEMYTITIYPTDGETEDFIREKNMFLNSIHFTIDKSAQTTSNEQKSKWQNQGRLAFKLAILAVAIIVIITIVISRNRKPK